MPSSVFASDGPRVGAFAKRYIRHTKGRWAGQPLVFEPWQQDFLDEAFRIDPTTGLRVYHEVVLGIPRKNGKSTLAAAVGLYLLTADGEDGPEVYAAAAAKAQAGIVFGQSRQFVTASPALQDFLRPRRSYIECEANNGVFRVISADAMLQHGLNPHGSIIDELHAHRSPDLYTALTTGSGARVNPLTMTITTAGYNEEQILGVIYHDAMQDPARIERRGDHLTIVRRPEARFLLWWYGASPDADPTDPAVWAAANPASWITPEYLAAQRHKPGMRFSDFQRYHLNQWVRVEESWLPRGSWAACGVDYPGLNTKYPVAVGIDIGLKDDTTSVVIAQRQPRVRRLDPETPRSDDLIVLEARFWANPYPAGHPRRDEWELDLGEVMDYLRSIRARFPAPARRSSRRYPGGPVFCYDPWVFKPSAQMLDAEGLVMVEVPQNATRMVPASTALYEVVTSGRLRHTGVDVTLTEHIRNVVPKHVGESGWRITKPPEAHKKIDGAVASAMAVYEALQAWPAERASAFVA